MTFDAHAFPNISCMLVTANGRFDCFKKSVECFEAQTYPNRELLIVNEGPTEYQGLLSEHVSGRPNVRTLFLDGKYTLGALRNVALAMSKGPVVVQWDDDDYNAPERLAVQFSHLRRFRSAAACFLTEQLHYYYDTGQLYWDSWDRFRSGGRKSNMLIPGTFMAWKDRVSARYPTGGTYCRAGEDSVMAGGLLADDGAAVLLSGYGHMHVYTYHGKNVWDSRHHREISAQRSMPVSHVLSRRREVCETLRFLDLPKPVRVMGREGLAFNYD